MRTRAHASPHHKPQAAPWQARAARAAGGGLLRLIAGAVLLAAALACGAWGIHGLILVIRAIP